MMNLNFEEKKSSFKLLAILLLVYAGLRMISLLVGYSNFLSWINVLSWGAIGIILLAKDIEKKYIVIPLGIVTLLCAYNLISVFRYMGYGCNGIYFVSTILELASLGIITFYSVNLWKKIEVPFLFKYWYLPAVCCIAANVVDIIGGFLCRMFY